MRLENLISESIKDTLREVTSKPKRRRIGKQLIASSNEALESKCKQLRRFEYAELQEKAVPVLMLWGVPQRILKDSEVKVYKDLGAKISWIKRSEIKDLK